MGSVESEPAFDHYFANPLQHLFLTLWMINFMVDGAPRHPGSKGCFVRYGSQKLVLLWALRMLWDAGKYKCVIPFFSSH
jgi:hypothetical protein